MLQTCPQCAGLLDIFEIDPPVDELERRLGTPVACLGGAEISRSILPRRGLLWGLTQGLLFVPHLTIHPRGGLVADEAEQSVLRRWGRELIENFAGIAPALPCGEIAELHGESPVDWLLDQPGAFFVSLKSVRTVKLRGAHGLRIDRTPWRTVSLQVTLGGDLLARQLQSIADEHADWQAALSPSGRN